MRIGINARFLCHPHTGIGQYTRRLLEALSRLDSQNEYLLFTPKLSTLALGENFRQIRIPERRSFSAALRKADWEYRLLPGEAKKLQLQLLHFPYPSRPLFGLGVPTLVTVHDVIPWVLPEHRSRLRSRLLHAYVAQALKGADHLLTVSEFSKGEMLELFSLPSSSVTVTPLAPTLPKTPLPQALSSRLRRPFLLYVGGYDLRKNVPLLMEAYQKFVANHHALDLVLVGAQGKGLEAFLTSAHQQKIAGRFPLRPKGQIVLTPPLSSQELACLYSQAKAFVHASFYEGFNLPLADALQAGIPAVVSDLPVHREVAGDAAHFASLESVDSFGLALHEFLNAPGLAQSLSRQAKARAAEFSWEACARKTLEAYCRLGEGGFSAGSDPYIKGSSAGQPGEAEEKPGLDPSAELW